MEMNPGAANGKALKEHYTYQCNIQKIDLEEKTQGTSCDLIRRSSYSIAQLIAHRQVSFLLSLKEKEKKSSL